MTTHDWQDLRARMTDEQKQRLELRREVEAVISDAITEKMPHVRIPSLMAWHIRRRLDDAGFDVNRVSP